MAYSTIPKGSLYMNTKLYTGNGSTQSITGVGFQPDMTWLKMTSNTDNHFLTDVVRGVTKTIYPNDTYAEETQANGLTAFGSDGFSIGSESAINGNTEDFVSWNWKANGSGSSNTAGSINSTVSANTTSGFSIVKYTGTGANATVGHGLGSVPKMIIVKDLTNAENWEVYNAALGPTKSFYLNATTVPFISSERWNDTSPTNSVFSLGTSKTNNNNANIIAYCFADVTGFSKFGSYTGNGSSDGTFIYTGFKPAFVIFKRTSGTGNWQLLDNKRLGYNVENRTIYPNTQAAQQDENDADLLSNGFKLRGSGTDGNGSGSTYIYMAFAENPFVATSGTNAVPVTAR